LAASRADGRASAWNAPLYHLAGRPLLLATEAVDVVPEIGCDERDLVSTSLSGVGPMYDTGLESALRRFGIGTVIATGVSVNVGILDLVLDSVNAGFEVVVPRDAVAGVPAAYAEAVIDKTLRLKTRAGPSWGSWSRGQRCDRAGQRLRRTGLKTGQSYDWTGR
jgi:nicotinamidase-related amidase